MNLRADKLERYVDRLFTSVGPTAISTNDYAAIIRALGRVEAREKAMATVDLMLKHRDPNEAIFELYLENIEKYLDIAFLDQKDSNTSTREYREKVVGKVNMPVLQKMVESLLDPKRRLYSLHVKQLLWIYGAAGDMDKALGYLNVLAESDSLSPFVFRRLINIGQLSGERHLICIEEI
jgi:hypothetical protein